MKDKKIKYYSESRPELLKFYPSTIKCLLDVGCSTAEFSGNLKLRNNTEVWGLELNEEAARVAIERIDKVFIGNLNDNIHSLPDGYFDCIACNDILEHLYEPEKTLTELKIKIKNEGVIVSSIPNFLYLPSLLKVAYKRQWDYTEEGTLDYTHIRFFTKKSIIKMFNSANYEVLNIEGINGLSGWKWKLFNKITFGYFNEYGFLQFVIIAKPRV
jgi:2-polyprenyl-3-methyl-5-hydroxy-6-metoxy-1,4-benzoquinol methylase